MLCPKKTLSFLKLCNPIFPSPEKTSSSGSSFASLFDDDDTNLDLALLGVDQPEPITEGSEVSGTSEVSLVGDVLPNMGYALGLLSLYSLADKTFLRHN